MWRGQLGPFGAPSDGRADAEFFPEGAGGEYHTKFEHPLDFDLRTIRCRRAAGGVISIVEDAVDTPDQPFEFGSIELIGTAETMHHMGFSSLCVGVPDALGEGVIGDA